MNNLKAAIERLKEAGKRSHDYTYINMVTEVKLCPAAPGGKQDEPCMCGADAHNAAVEAAAAGALAEVEKQAAKLDCLLAAVKNHSKAQSAYDLTRVLNLSGATLKKHALAVRKRRKELDAAIGAAEEVET
jgi:hypothetical protein